MRPDTHPAPRCSRQARHGLATLITTLITTLMAWQLALTAAMTVTSPLHAAPAEPAAPLLIGNRTVHVFRAPLGALTAAERADNARQKITAPSPPPARAGPRWQRRRAV